MELKPSQYEAALRLLKIAGDALVSVVSSVKRHEDASRIRRGLEETESLLKKVKQELRIG